MNDTPASVYRQLHHKFLKPLPKKTQGREGKLLNKLKSTIQISTAAFATERMLSNTETQFNSKCPKAKKCETD